MSKVAVQTNDIWVPPDIGYDEAVSANLTLAIEVTNPDSSVTLWAQSDIVMVPGLANAFFAPGDWAQHIAGGTSLDIVKLESGGVAGTPGEIAAAAAKRRTARMGREPRR